MKKRMKGTGDMANRVLRLGAVLAAATLTLAACGGNSNAESITISGSTTVAPITQAVATDGKFSIDMTIEGTTAGFERFCAGETHINNASEAIPGSGQPVDYIQKCADSGVEFIELPVALDALSIVRHIDNDFAMDLTLDELSRIWEPDSTVTTWSDVRPEWPNEDIVLVGRSAGSGTFEYFTHHVTGEVGAIRDDYQATEDSTELVDAIAADPNALGFVGVGNYLAADESVRDVITTVAVDGVEPTLANAQNGSYSPFTRPLFLYVSVGALEENEDVAKFVEHYLESVHDILPRVHFYRLPADAYENVAARFEARSTGSTFEGDPYKFASVEDLFPEN